LPVPWVPELPYFDGLVAGDADALVDSFAEGPRLHHPLRGSIEGEYEFREFVADTERWLREREARVEEVHRGGAAGLCFEEAVVHLRGPGEPIDLPHAMVATLGPEGRIAEIRVYFSTRPLTGRATDRAPLLAGDPALRLGPAEAEFAEAERGHGVEVEPCVLVEDEGACALEYNAHRPGTDAPIQAALAVCVHDEDGGLAAARSYDDVDRRNSFRAET
jgi:ketosteroid isomerase-like protein